jgi:hypothetical protein
MGEGFAEGILIFKPNRDHEAVCEPSLSGYFIARSNRVR